MPEPIRDIMFTDFRNRSIFEKAQQYAFDYLNTVMERHVRPTDEAVANLKVFEEDIPRDSSDAEAVLDLLHTYGSPATSTILGGRYFGFVNGGAVPAGLAAKQLATYWDQNSAMQAISPIASKLEAVVEVWLQQILGLPLGTAAGFVSGTSAANFCGLAAARFRQLKKLGWDVNEKGLFGAPKLRIVAGTHAHSTAIKAISLLGFGKANIEWVESDDQGRMLANKLPDLDESCIVVTQAGNVNSGSFDPFAAICEKANKAGAWVHVDGAFGLWAAASAETYQLVHGFENANSWAVDGHKTLNTPYDCGIVLCEDREALVSALHMSGAYIVLGDERDGMFFTPEMSRRARVVELWATMKFLGCRGIVELVNGLCERASQFADEITKSDGFEVLNEVVFNQVMVQCETNEMTERVLKRIQELRDCWVGGSTWHGRRVIRISICSWATTPEDISRSVASFERAWKEVLAEV